MFEEQTDKLLIRLIYTLVIIVLLYVYKYAHRILYPSATSQLFKKLSPSLNSSDTIHYMSRLIGFGIVFSHIKINVSNGMLLALFDTLFQGVLSFVLYLLTLFIGEQIALYNFTYQDEIIKRKNIAYGVICFTQSIAIALIIKNVLSIADHSLVIIFFLWLYSCVLFGFAIKGFHFYSKLSFNRLVTQKNLAVALSYSGFILGCTFLINASLSRLITTIPEYIQLVLLQVILSCIIFPLFYLGIKKVFLLNPEKGSTLIKFDKENPEVGFGVYEGGVFLTAAFLTSVITAQILFGHFYLS